MKHRSALVLPGVGELCLESSAATINSTQNSVASAETILALKKVSNSDLTAQNDFLSKEWLCEPIKAHAVVQKISSAIISSCANKKPFDLADLGEFQLREGLIHFVSSGELEKSYNYFSRPIPIVKAFVPRKTEIEEIQEEEEIVLEVSRSIDNTGKKSNRALYVKMVAAGLIFALIALVGINYFDGGTNFLVPVKYDLESVDYNQDEINRSPETDGSETNIDLVVDGEQSNIDESTNSDLSIFNADPIEIENSTSLDPNSETLTTAAEQCIYILGSFSKAANTQKMMKRIKSMGLAVYQAPFNGSTRIGVIIDCSDTDALHNIHSLQENPWLLK